MVRPAVPFVGLVFVLAVALSGCVQQPLQPAEPTATPRPTQTSSAVPVDPDSAAGRQAVFDATNTRTIDLANGKPKGRAFVDGLVAAGFDKSAMQLTADKTAIGLDADNLQFSVQIGDECLIGQFGNVGYHSAILPATSTSGCLIGKTRPIDW